MGTPNQRPRPIGDMTVLDIEVQRLVIQQRLDAEKAASERNRLGQFATPPASPSTSPGTHSAYGKPGPTPRRSSTRPSAVDRFTLPYARHSRHSSSPTLPVSRSTPAFAEAANRLLGSLRPADHAGRFHEASARPAL